jgi:hypothetical protein
MAKVLEDVALFDMDGTLCDYNTGLIQELEKLRSPSEPPFHPPFRDMPKHIEERANIIRKSEEWWASLPKFQLGWDVLKIARNLKYDIMILTQGPRRNPYSWSGKKRWIDANLGEDIDITITRKKSLVYGKVLVDDYPGYVREWLAWRPRGVVIMPANTENQGYKHPQVIRYDGTNLDQVKEAMQKAKRT